MAEEVPVRVLAPGVSGIDGLDPDVRRRLERRDLGRRTGGAPAGALTEPWPLGRARKLLEAARRAGSAVAAREFGIPLRRLVEVLAAHGLELGPEPRESAPTASTEPASAPTGPPAGSGAPAGKRRGGGRPVFWTLERVQEVHQRVLAAGSVSAVAQELKVTPPYVFALLKKYGLAGPGRTVRPPKRPVLVLEAGAQAPAAPAPRPLVAQGSVREDGPGSQVGHLDLACPACGTPLQHTTVLRAAGGRS